MGRILFAPQQDIASLQPVMTYSDDNSSLLYPEITTKHDLYGVPNVVEVVYSKTGSYYYARVVNDDVTTGHFVINSKNFSLDAKGNASFSGTITGSSGEFTKGFYVNIPDPLLSDQSDDSSWELKISKDNMFLGRYISRDLIDDPPWDHYESYIKFDGPTTAIVGGERIYLDCGSMSIDLDRGNDYIQLKNSKVGITIKGSKISQSTTQFTGDVNATGYTVTATNLTAKSKLTVSGNSYFGGSGTFGGGLSVPCIEMIYSTPYIDFHYNNSKADYTTRFIDYGANFTYYTNSGIHQFCNIDGSQVARIQSNGTFGAAVGGTALVGSAIYCQTTWSGGAYTAVYGASFTNPSSRLVKKNIINMSEEEAKKILLLNPVDFDYIKEFGGEKNQRGLIAEDVLNIIPFCVTVPDDYDEAAFNPEKGLANALLGIDYSKLVPYLVKMIQIQQKQIDKLLSTQQKGE